MSSSETECTQEISASLQMDGMDVENVTNIVGALSDVSGLDKILQPALLQLFCERSGTSRHFQVTINGVTLRISNICTYEQTYREQNYYKLSMVEDEVASYVDVTAIDKVLTNTYNQPAFYDVTFRKVAELIVNLCKERKICKLCSQLNPGMDEFDMCAGCACSEPLEECIGCGIKRGRTENWDGEGHEHCACKRRRVMEESD